MVASGPLDGFLAARARLIADAEPGTRAARSLSDLTDAAILERARVAAPALPVPFALLALGGYGAQRLLPNSDIDLLVVSKGTGAVLEPLVRAVLYPLWDAGLAVGHQVRTPRGQTAALGEDLRNTTGFLSARLLAGDEALGGRAIADGFRRLRRDVRRVRALLLERDRPGSPFLLEPDLKEGAGGQRDVDEILWHAALLGGAPGSDLAPLVAEGLLTADEASSVRGALETLTTARWVLHRDDPRAGNLLALDDAGLPGLDADAVQRALGAVNHALLALRERLGARPAAPVAGSFGLADLRALAGGSLSVQDAERAAYAGGVDDALPGFSDLMTLRRPALSHRYTVGAHTLRTVQALGDEPPTPPSDAALADATLVAALAHDVGKREPTPGHAARGEAVAQSAARALGLDEETVRIAGTLAAEHLLLSEMAAHADPADEDAVLAAAARLGDARIVRALRALTAADIRATAADAWTPWRAALVGEIASRLEAALSPDIDGAGIVAAAEATRAAALRDAASAGASRAVLSFLEHASLRYLARRTPADALRDARLVQSIAGPGAPGRFAFGVTAGPAEGTWLVDVVTRDRPGLFSMVSGVLALAGLSALSAEAHTDRSGVAIDTFVVTSATRAAVDSAAWNSFERMMGLALTANIDLDTRLTERRRHYPPTARASVGTRVSVGPAGPFTTPVRVKTPDRVGLLYDLARAHQDAGLDIRRAMITTQRGVASDLFEVVDAAGAPPEPKMLRDRLVPKLEAAARA